MKKVFFALVMVGAFLTSCNNSGTKSAAEAEVGGKEKANEIIGFYNKAMDLSRRYNSSFVERSERYAKEAEEFIQKKLRNDFAIQPTLIITFFDAGKNAEAVPSDAFGDKKESIQKDFNSFKEHAMKIKELLETIKAHLQAEDFKDDKGKKFSEIKEQLLAEVEAYQKTRSSLFGQMNELVEKAESVILEDHPLKENILSSKKLLALSGDFLDEVIAESEAGKVDEAKLDAAYKAIEDQLATNQKLDVKDENVKDEYESLNKSCEDYLGSIRKLVRNAKENKKFSENDYNAADRDYESLINAYNRFVD